MEQTSKKVTKWLQKCPKIQTSVEKFYFQAFFKMAAFSKTGAWLWMRMVEMDEIGI